MTVAQIVDPLPPRSASPVEVAAQIIRTPTESDARSSSEPRPSPDSGSSDDLPPEEPPLRVMALHAILYCERLFYLEEVEEIRVADFAVYAGRRLHDDLAPLDDESPDRRRCEVASEAWGVFGMFDAVRRRDGVWVAYEHKRGRSRRGEGKEVLPWPSDRIQAIAYAVLLEESLGEPVPQARVRYHADNATAFVTIDEAARVELRQAIDRARGLRRTTIRPPVAENENLCKRCSLAPVCLPEEERLVSLQTSEVDADPEVEAARPEAATAKVPTGEAIESVSAKVPADDAPRHIPTLFPSNRERQTLHVMSPRAYVSRSGEALIVTVEDEKQRVPIEEIDAVVIHGYGQITTQAIHLCAHRGVSVEWLTGGGKFAAGTTASSGRVQQRIRQYAALSQPEVRVELTRRLVEAKIETELKYVLRATRGNPDTRTACRTEIEMIRETLRKLPLAGSADTLRGLEGMAAKAYFACFPQMLARHVPKELRPKGKRAPPPFLIASLRCGVC